MRTYGKTTYRECDELHVQIAHLANLERGNGYQFVMYDN
jgi:hypothetical protein